MKKNACAGVTWSSTFCCFYVRKVSADSPQCVFSHCPWCNIVVFQVPYEYPPAGPDTESSEDSGDDSALGEEAPTECNCEPGEPGFAGFAGPKVPTHFILSYHFILWKQTLLFVLLTVLKKHMRTFIVFMFLLKTLHWLAWWRCCYSPVKFKLLL